MSSIKDYFRTRENSKPNPQAEKILKEHQREVNNLEENLKKYQNLSQEDLMTELFKEASRLKQNGSLNSQTLNSLQATLSPMLSEQQNKQLNDILKKLK